MALPGATATEADTGPAGPPDSQGPDRPRGPAPRRPRVLLAMDPGVAPTVLTPAARERLRAAAEVDPDVPPLGPDAPASALAEAEVLLTGWGCPRLDAAVLDRAPALRAVCHAAGTVKTFVTDEVFARGVRVSSAADANAVPVAEFSFAAIVFGAKRAFTTAHRYATGPTKRNLEGVWWLGTRGITVGVVGASRIGRRVVAAVRERLETARVLVHDPYLTAADARELGVERAGMDALARHSDVVTLHAPALRETRHLLDRRRSALLRDGAVVVNTARGSLLDTEALTEEAASGRLDAVLDVTDPEPLPAGHPLFTLPNVHLTPHIAGALGNEVTRLGDLAVSEVARYAGGLPFRHEVRAEDWDRIA